MGIIGKRRYTRKKQNTEFQKKRSLIHKIENI